LSHNLQDNILDLSKTLKIIKSCFSETSKITKIDSKKVDEKIANEENKIPKFLNK